MKASVTAALLLVALHAMVNAEEITVATYNIRFLNANVSSQGSRQARLQSVIENLGADVIGLQEIDDREALEAVFDTSVWDFVIDDESGFNQDVALATRKSKIEVLAPTDGDADNAHFLFPGSTHNSEFPNRRDGLIIELKVKATGDSFHAIVIHAKSRKGGRANTDHRRENAARKLIEAIEQDFDEKPLVLLGDFNDNPDDKSLNILETGNPSAIGQEENTAGPFLFNLTEPLLLLGHVSSGRTNSDILPNGKINVVDSGSRTRNNSHRGDNTHTGDILFDQILVSDELLERYVADSVKVFDGGVAVQGSNSTRASDHLPVLATLMFENGGPVDPETPVQVRIAALLPNPDGPDQGREEVHLKNNGTEAVNLDGWTLQDLAVHEFALSGQIAAGATITITLPSGQMPLNNTGDTIVLFDADGEEVDEATYDRSDVEPGTLIMFE